MHSFTESFALYIQFISIYLHFDKFVYIRLRAIYGNHILLEAAVKNEGKKLKKSSTGLIDHLVRTTRTHEPMYHYHHHHHH